SFGTDTSFRSAPTITSDQGATATSGTYEGFKSDPRCSTANGRTLTMSDMYGMRGTNSSIGSSCTVTDLFIGGNADDITTLNGTVTRAWGWHVGGLTKGTARFPFGATAHAITGTVPSNEGVWGVETHTPTRLYFKNDSNQTFRMGTIAMTAMGTSLSNSSTNYFFT